MKRKIYNKLIQEGRLQVNPIENGILEDNIPSAAAHESKSGMTSLERELNSIKKSNFKRISNGPEGEERYELTINRAQKKIKLSQSQEVRR